MRLEPGLSGRQPAGADPALASAPPGGGATQWTLPGGVRARSTGRAEGNLSGRSLGHDRRRRLVVDLPWVLPRQVHGRDVLVVDGSLPQAGIEADAVVSCRDGVAVAVLTADCAPVAMASPEGVFAVAHAGWRGLEAGVIEAAAGAMRDVGATDIAAVLGPCIHPECYEFGAGQLERLQRHFGDAVATLDAAGAPAFDLPAAVAIALDRCEVTLLADARACTACSAGYWSWRARGDQERQAMVVWRR